MRLQMEKALIKQHVHTLLGPSNNLALSILDGNDDTIEFEDFLGKLSTDMVDARGNTERIYGMV